MSRQWLTVSLEELRYRVLSQLSGAEEGARIPELFIWQDGASEVLVFAGRQELRLANGWLVG